MPHGRRPDIDALRVFAVGLLFVYHAGKIFEIPAAHYRYPVENPELSVGLTALTLFLDAWHMPLLFLLAGWAAVAALARQDSRTFLAERLTRLVVPLAAGIVLFGPALKYLELRAGVDARPSGLRLAPPIEAGFLDFVPDFFTHVDRATWSHLWFLAYLAVLSLVWLPPLRRLAARRPQPAPGWWLALPLLPLAMVEVVLRPFWPGYLNLYDDWANVAQYSLFFLAGAVLARRPGLEAALRRDWPAWAVAAVAAYFAARIAAWPLLLPFAEAAAAWCGVAALLGLGGRLVRRSDPTLAYLAEAGLPVYVLHHLPLLLIGTVVVRQPWPVAAKFAAILFGSVVVTMAIYELARRFAWTRFLLGMKPARPLRRPVAAPA